jgi:hypothetical protein
MTKSKFLKLKNTRLSNYIELRTNRVLEIDDISSEFSSSDDSRELFSNILTIDSVRNYNRFLVQIIDTTKKQHQLTELITINDNNNIYTLTKGSITTEDGNDLFADVYGFVDTFNNMYLRFEPENPFEFDYDIKILRNEFLTRSIGVNTVSIGYIDIFANNALVLPQTTSNILSLNVNEYSSVHASLNIINANLEYKSYVEIYLTHDGENTYLSEFYFDDIDQYNGRYIGSFTSYISGGILKLDFVNDTPSDTISVRCRNVGFGSTSIGSGIYRFKSDNEPDGIERSATYESNISYTNSGIPGVVISLNKNLFSSIKSLVRVSVGDTTALHQLLTIHDGDRVHVSQYPFLSIGSTSGIGTFGGEYLGNNVQIKFYPDPEFSGNIEILSFNENIYKLLDIGNEYKPLEYLPNSESIVTSSFFGTNLETINKTNFEMRYNGVPIFSKKFNPANTSVLNKETGLFNINNHFFSTEEELIYTPKSSFLDIDASAVGIGLTLSYTGIVTDRLPDRVYAIKINNDQFKIATRKEYAQAGIFVTFTSSGEGNAHEFEMVKKNEKSLITVNDLTQYPLAYTSLAYNLSENGGQISAASSVFSLSGISSINPTDLLKINDEYMYVTNVGLGTTSIGPITFVGDFSLVEVSRGFVGTSATTHLDGDLARIYRGSYNIVGNEIHFTNPPRGSSFYVSDLDFSNLIRNKATFNGRVFLRQRYDTNTIYDNISEKFTGLDKSYTLTVEGNNTVGLGTSGGNGIVFINSIFQTPTTLNNTDNNFEIIEDTNAGITSISFTGITDENGDIIISESDVNQNQLPRGGLIVSLGSTAGLGYAPLVGASVTAVLNQFGAIVGFGTTSQFGSGYISPVSIGVTQNGHSGTEAIITANVGAGGTLSLNIINAGSGYTNPIIRIPSPSYENLPVVGVSRLGIGQTTETGTGLLMTMETSPSESKPISGRNADASNLILRNSQLIAEVSVGRTLDNYPGFSIPGGNQKCIDDIIGILRSLTYNLSYGGNDQIYDAAKIYVDNDYLSGEEEESIYAYEQVKLLAIQVMRNEPIDIGGYSVLDQYFDLTIEGDISGIPGVYNPGDCSDVESAIASFVGIVTTAIDTGNLPTRTISPASLFEISSFKISRNGYGFRRGDVFKPVGLVTDANLSQPLKEFELTVLDIFNDSFGAWQFGELNYIDSIKNFQDGKRTRFPLFYNSGLLSFEVDESNPDSQLIDLDSVLVIFVNGILQIPKKSYQFNGGTSFRFNVPPKPEDNIAIFFYIGTENEDSVQIIVSESLRIGDQVQVLSNNELITTTISQNKRTITDIASSDKIETSLYTGPGIDDANEKPISWIKQKRDLLINGENVFKSRDSLEPQIYPTSRVIKSFGNNDTEIFVDNIDLFSYDNDNPSVNNFDLLLSHQNDDIFPAGAIPVVSSNGTIQNLIITNPGSGYIGTSVEVKFSNPTQIGGITARAFLSISNGQVSLPATITNPGSGYSQDNPPQVIIEYPKPSIEYLSESKGIVGFNADILSIDVGPGINTNLGLKFEFYRSSGGLSQLQVGYPIYVFNTLVGNGTISILSDDSEIIGIGTTCLDNIYYVSAFDVNTGIATCNISSTTNITGITTSGAINSPVGKMSWGRISGFNRSENPLTININGNTTSSGLSTYPVVQRRGYGLRDTGSIKKAIKSI